MNKLDRIAAILIRLQSRSVTTAQQLAEQFNVSLRTVYRDIRVLEDSGIPIVGNAGVGYSLMDGYKLPPLMFTREEAIAFLMAEKIVKQEADRDSYELFRSGMDKIRAVLRTSEKDILEHIDGFVEILDKHVWEQSVGSNEILQPLLHNILQKNIVKMEYYANYNQQITTRDVEPLGLSYMSGGWYLLAYCLLRKDYRLFKIVRVRQITSLDRAFTKQHLDFKSLISKLYSTDVVYDIKLRIDKTALRDIANVKYAYGLYEESMKDAFVEQSYKTYSLEHFGRWYLSFADKATIVEPHELKDVVRALVAKIKV